MLWRSVWIERIFYCLNFWWVTIAWQQNLNQFQFLWQFIWIVDSVCYFQIHFEIFPLIWFFFSVYTKRNNVWFSTKTIAKRLKTLKKCFVYQKIVGCLFDLDELHEKRRNKIRDGSATEMIYGLETEDTSFSKHTACGIRFRSSTSKLKTKSLHTIWFRLYQTSFSIRQRSSKNYSIFCFAYFLLIWIVELKTDL